VHIFLLLFNSAANGFLSGGSGTAVRHSTQKIYMTHKMTHHAQTDYAAQSYTNSKGHITHTLNTTQKSEAIPVTGLGGI
jgi:hypothetical protein